VKLRTLTFSAAVLALAYMNAPTASAHAALESTKPAKGSVVSKTTNQVLLQFGEEILVFEGRNPNSISVTDSHGKAVTSGDVVVAGSNISRSLKTPLATGKYLVKYRAVSADGHVVTGSYTFSVK
jgi:methionine-rich copper-binding protein CopC